MKLIILVGLVIVTLFTLSLCKVASKGNEWRNDCGIK